MPTSVVIGASGGIGLELVKQLAARGDKVFATCRSKAASATGKDQISEVGGDITIIEGIDIAQDSVVDTLKASALAGVTVDLIIHNAGSLNGSRDVAQDKLFEEQKLENIAMETMRRAFEVNTLGPLKVQQVVTPQMTSPGGKVVIISTGMGSIGDNGSGGIYAYRTSKAAVNMVGKSMSCDLKGKGISVAVIAPGTAVTDFGPGEEAMAKWGSPVDVQVRGILKAIDAMTMDNTGEFTMVATKTGEPGPFPW